MNKPFAITVLPSIFSDQEIEIIRMSLDLRSDLFRDHGEAPSDVHQSLVVLFNEIHPVPPEPKRYAIVQVADGESRPVEIRTR